MGEVIYKRTGYVQVKKTDINGSQILDRKESIKIIRRFTWFFPGNFKVGESVRE